MTETGDISKLADILHQNGDKVLNALSKLSLNVTLLQKINKEFETFLESNGDNGKFHVLSNSSSNSQAIQDLHFLHDFMQKTVGLKIINNANLMLLDNKVDISKFKSIKYLEIKKVPVKEIIGLKVVQPHLESVVCMKCLSKLEELLAECGGDNSSGFVWSELKEAVLSYNNIKILDTSIAFAPWLQILDLSHNKLVNVKAIECLPNLKYINLSFNCLSAIPTFSKSARKRMQVLVIKNNYIEDLSGLAGLDHLTELDVSWNWVSSYDSLQPLLTMSALQNFSLKRNPISYHKNYRKNVVGYFHISASFSDFLFDGSKLSKFEKSIVGYKLCQTVRTISSSNLGPGPSSSSSVSIQSSIVEAGTSDKGSVAKKSGKVRLAVIPNLDDGTYEEIPAESSAINFKESLSTDHLITKKKIEDARATYGSDNWLRCEAGSVVQDILGLPPPAVLSSTPVDYRCLEAAFKSEENKPKAKGVAGDNSEVTDKAALDSFGTCADDYPSDYYSLENQNNPTESSGEKVQENTESKETSPDFETIQESSEEIEDENEKLYLVSKISKSGNNVTVSEELFLTLTDLELKERDYNRGRVINKWSISSLESCVKLRSNKLQLCFDTVKRDKREREYEMEEAEAHSLFKILTEILESRTLQDMNQIAYRCVSCLCHFSKYINTRKQDSNSRCPFCYSKLILEVDDHSPPYEEKSTEKIQRQANKRDVKVSHNRSSSTGFVQGITNQAPSNVVKCSSQSSIGSAASLDELNELPANQNASAKRSDSDIEILSNPSQSSIEVIDGPSRAYGGTTPGRKRSSEERQVQPRTAVPECASHPSNVGLTESSSSGSVTDSVCTAYESSGPQAIHKLDHPMVVEEAQALATRNQRNPTFPGIAEREEAAENRDLNYQNWNELDSTRDEIQYSYTDFAKVDHRIKLFLYSQVFEESNEDFCFGLRCSVLLVDSSNSFESFVVFSNKKFYILKIIGFEEGDDASEFLQKPGNLRRSLRLLKSLSLLAWEQGFSLKLEDVQDKLRELLIFFKDPNRTRNFLKFVQSSDSFPNNCSIIAEFSPKPVLAMQHLLVSGASQDPNIRYFSFLRTCSVIRYPDVKQLQSVAILVTDTNFLLFSSEPFWLFDGNDSPPQPVVFQKMNNLMNAWTTRSPIGKVDDNQHKTAVEENPSETTRRLAARLQVAIPTVLGHLSDRNVKELDGCVPHVLSEYHQENRFESYCCLAFRLKGEPFLHRREAERCRIYLQFFNESGKHEEIWDMTMETEEGIQALINAVRLPWERMFSIPFHVSRT